LDDALSFVDPEGSPDERAARLRETYRLMCVKDLKDVEFRNQLRLAHSEGLLIELMQAAELPLVQGGYLGHKHSEESARLKAGLNILSIRSPASDRGYLLSAFEWLSLKSWFRRGSKP
jgi:hypothetical protein